MGRKKLKMELIPKEKERMSSFKKRKEGLTKKLEELKILCGVDACMIIYGPNGEVEPEVYPNSLYETCRVIQNYRLKKGDPTKCKTVGLSDFFQEMKKKAEEELMKVKKDNMNAKYPTWNDTLDEVIDPLVLRALADQLSVKSQIVKSKIEFLKSIKNQEIFNQFSLIDDVGFSSTNMQPYNSGDAVEPTPSFIDLTGEEPMHPMIHTGGAVALLPRYFPSGDYLLPGPALQPEPYVDFDESRK